MLTLGIHTAGAACEVAVLRGDETLAHVREEMKRGHDQRLPILTQDALQTAHVSLSEIDRFAVCVGPGSFTGIRVGVAFARGLALAQGKTAFGVTSLETLCADHIPGPAIALLPAKQRLPDISFWAQGFETEDLLEPVELGIDEIITRLSGGVSILLPDDLNPEISEMLPAGLNKKNVRNGADKVAQFAARNMQSSPRSAAPVYARAPDAAPPKQFPNVRHS
jgi:tRNA threonylcarbamoyladenosine biosynthesis protein TsaB